MTRSGPWSRRRSRSHFTYSRCRLVQYLGKLVVLAFYPLDRSQGCTIELTTFRDEFGSFFGEGTVVLPASVDSVASHASWAKDAHFSFAMIADTAGVLAKEYESAAEGRKYFQRTAFVTGKDGKLAYADLRFNASSQDSYDRLQSAIKAAKAQ
ncbi:MAG: redoxin domain-containing protein [Gemmatimonadales bacterium]